MEMILPPVLNEARLDAYGVELFKEFGTYETDRKMVEEKWLRALRQYRGIYDPEINIPKDRSRAYPRLTAWMVKGTIARLMQIAFPNTEKIYGVKSSVLPDLSAAQLQAVLDQLVAENPNPKDEEIEKAIHEFAKGKAERMELKVDDDLMQMDFLALARKVIRSAVIFGLGVLKGPLHIKIKARTWQRNRFTGKLEAVEVDKYQPLFEFLPVWNYYPDLTAVSLDKQDGRFERHVMTRAQVEELADRPDFLKDRVIRYLADHDTGNYRARQFESDIKSEPKSAQGTVKESRKFEVLSYWGGISGHDLFAAGVPITEDDLGRTFQGNAWAIDNVVIKVRLQPLGDAIRHHHEFIFEDDELSIVGNGLPETLRDSQLSICETARAALDNMSVIGPQAVVNDDLLTPGQSTNLSKHKTWHVEGLSGNQLLTAAVGNLTIDSHLSELITLLNLFFGIADKESGLPPAAMGDTSGGGSEALRTSKNASMFLGAAALPVRDTMRNFDIFTKSVVSADVAWNQKYDPNPTRDGDHDVVVRGSTSLIAKEVLARSLTEFRANLQPTDLPYIKMGVLLKAWAKANDIDVAELFEDDKVAEQNVQMQQQAQQQQMQGQVELVQAQIKELLTRAMEHQAKAEAEGANVGANVFQILLDAISSGQKAQSDQMKATAAMTSATRPTGGTNGNR